MGLRDIDKIKEGKEQKTYPLGILAMISFLLFLLGIVTGIYISDFLKEIFKVF